MCAESLAGHGGPAFCGGVLTGRGWVWQAVGVETESISVGELLNDPANVRQHGARNLETIKASLARFGQQKPIVVDGNGVVVAGNGTLAAARELGWQSVHVVRSGLTGSDRTAYAIADNRTAELAEWDDAALAEQLSALAIDDAELLAAAGYDPGELEALADAVVGGGEVVEDEAPEPPADPVTQPGDLWQLGDHRVLCGDCRISSDVSALLGGTKINVALTSPPYASQRKYDESSGFKPISPDDYVEWFEAVQANVAEHIADDGSWFVNIKEHCDDGQRSLYVKDLTLAHVRKWGWRFVDEYIWTHGGTPKAAQQRFKNGWEPVFMFSMGRHKFRPESVLHETDSVPDWKGLHPNAEKVQQHGFTEGMRRLGVNARATKYTAKGGRTQRGSTSKNQGSSGLAYPSNVLSLGKNSEALGHSAAFPVGLPVFFIKSHTDEGDAIFDPFLGSGTTLVAAEQLGRKCYGVEISPAYCDVIVERWENLTGGKAKRVAGG